MRREADSGLCSKYKIPDYQDGHAYLTSHRVCYVDNKEPRKFSVAVNLKDVERPEFYVCAPSVGEASKRTDSQHRPAF